MRRVAARFDRGADDLLAEFAATGGHDCFEEIVRRYSAMVLNVCRQTTGHREDAEDAAQAVFLVLAERLRAGETIRSPGAWLQQVARRASVDIRRSRARRRKRERDRAIDPAAATSDSPADDAIARIIREELDRLPAKYRIPLVLHYFNGHNFVEAAKELGIKPSTLGVRLFRGRKILAQKLARRGVTISTIALATLLASVVRRSVSDALVRSMAKAAAGGGAGSPLVAGPALGHGLTVFLGSSHLKLLATAALLAAAAVGARAAVQWHGDLPLRMELRQLLPSMGDIRSRIPHLHAQAAATQDVQGLAEKSLASGDSPVPLNDPRGAISDPLHGYGTSSRLVAPGIANVADASNARSTISPKIGSGSPFAPSAASVRGSTQLAADPPPLKFSAPKSADSGFAGAPVHVASAGQSGRGVVPPSSAPGHVTSPTNTAGPTNTSGMNAGSTVQPGGNPGQPQSTASPINTLHPGVYSPAWWGTSDAPNAATTFIWDRSASQGAFGAIDSVQLTLHASSPDSAPQLAFLDKAAADLPPGYKSLGVWAIAADQPLGSLKAEVRFDANTLKQLGGDTSHITLWGYDGAWKKLGTTNDLESGVISGEGNNLQFITVAVPEPTALALAMLGAAGLLLRRRSRRES
ncbi:MAG TPA: sigma-70 family RNA polymerase sigma factor [Humisphaera sp.]|nr:sigma-70 family RNA polymerase sigma factor [Humisphaera sp.]